ncbi:MAG: hypothetical protein AAGD43_19330 [Pseudomonadota bacterium]
MSPGKPSLMMDIPELEIDRQSVLNFMSQYEPFLSSVTEILSKHLGRTFECGHEYVPAIVLFNPLVADHVFWIGTDKEYGKSKADDALQRLKRFERWLSKTDLHKLPDPKPRRIVEGVTILSGPLYFFVIEALRSLDTIQIRSAIRFLIEHQEQCLTAQAKRGGKYRAFRTAVALRAVFEVYSDIPITQGDKFGAPTGPFCKCLEELYEIGRVEGGFRHYAREAKKLSSGDSLLVSLKNELLTTPARVEARENR